MSSRAESKTASQFVSLTMRLKDKLHPQRIKRFEQIKQTPSQTPKPLDLNLQRTLQEKSVCVLADEQRAVISSLQYFKALVDRLGVDKQVLDQSVVGGLLGGASSRVLEAVQTLVQLEPHLHNSKTVTSCLTRLYLSLAQLIRWADEVMLQGIAHGNQDSTASVTLVIRAVLDGVKELVRLAAERRGDSAPLSPVQFGVTEGQTCVFDDVVKSEGTSAGALAEEDEEKKKTSWAPPKPPMPLTELISPVSLPVVSQPPVSFPHVSLNHASQTQMALPPASQPQVSLPRVSTQGLSPPTLPPKRRQSMGPAPCRVAIVAPMRRETEVNRQSQLQEDAGLKCDSFSSAESAAENTHCGEEEEDPDYNFLLTDSSSFEPPLPLPHPSSLPPNLPEKRRCSTAGPTLSQPSSFSFDPPPHEQRPSHCDDDIGPDELGSSPKSPSKTPPPLPEKKLHIHQYLQFCSTYSAQSAAMFYQRPLTSGQRYSSRQRELETTYRLAHTHLDTQTLDSTPLPELLPAPVLPAKKRQQDPGGPYEEDPASDSLQQEAELKRRSRELQEEVLLTDGQEVLRRIIMKPQGEDGPDVKAASAEILLVHATMAHSEQVVYREAFLSTFRSFISPEDVIIKLQHRYKHLCKQRDPERIAAANNTFHLLVSVVDELCAIELDSNLLLLLMDLVFSLLIGGELRLACLLRSNILSKLEQRWHMIGSPQSLRPLAAKGVAARPGTLLDFRSQDLAEQLTLLDSELFCKIELPEVLLWSKEQNEEKSPNLKEFTQHFNNVSFWVRSVIILQDKSQDREKLLLKFLKTMKHLRRLNNFNSYLSILSALDSAPLRRLDWQRHTAEALEEFSSLIDSSSSFRAYRAALAEVEPPCIPYLGLILQDLTFVHLGNPDTLMTSQGSKVNFSKRWQQFNILDTLRSYQQVPYTLQPNDDIISFFNDFSDHLAEEALWELSLRLRPRNAPRANQR
uniref:rap guanine nucleotide exchange factor 1 isoform X1 n=1 Tax=Gasterosteus aculeatus aculeatus TaxID=481459 RepID=UPI001A9A06E3|nr:rap guanine nucleotide exchange factor 1 isoform X1 [Gasterosteus aculeatus aculeatus]